MTRRHSQIKTCPQCGIVKRFYGVTCGNRCANSYFGRVPIEPTDDDIAKEAASIRGKWSPTEEQSRIVGLNNKRIPVEMREYSVEEPEMFHTRVRSI